MEANVIQMSRGVAIEFPWETWFAWRPVKPKTIGFVWLRRIERQPVSLVSVDGFHQRIYNYR